MSFSRKVLAAALPLALATAPASAKDDPLLDKVQKAAVQYFWDNASPSTGLVLDRANNQQPSDLKYTAASIAATGFGLSALVVGAKRGWLPEDKVQDRVRTTLQTFEKMPSEHGFFYHFVDPLTGQRMWKSELSPIDTTLFLAGALTAAQAWPDSDIAQMANDLYEKVDWPWMTNGGAFIRMGWTPENGFIPGAWDHYDESSVMDVLAIGSPTHPIPASTWQAIKREPTTYGGHTYLNCPPLFTHQYSQLWLDLRGQTDGQFNYFDSSRQATLANRQFAIDHQGEHRGYGPDSWGLTASDGPDGYDAFGIPDPQDGTIAPTGAIGSFEFTPQESMSALRHMASQPQLWGRYGLTDAYNADRNWVDKDVLGIDQGAEVLSIENQRSGLVWQLFGQNAAVRQALQKIGFHKT
ncbi:MAG TPA: glucoamylase family protein [Candidatus Xenobia bacterium]